MAREAYIQPDPENIINVVPPCSAKISLTDPSFDSHVQSLMRRGHLSLVPATSDQLQDNTDEVEVTVTACIVPVPDSTPSEIELHYSDRNDYSLRADGFLGTLQDFGETVSARWELASCIGQVATTLVGIKLAESLGGKQVKAEAIRGYVGSVLFGEIFRKTGPQDF